MTPITAAINKTAKLLCVAKTTPLSAIVAEPTRRIFRRPKESATKVSSKEMKTSPTSVRDMKIPIKVSEFLRAERWRARIRVLEP